MLIRAKTVDGLTLAIDPESYLDGFILRTGYYEREVIDAILRYLPENGVLWDVGANIGLHSVTAKMLRPDATVIAFEPVPFLTARLSLNCELNDLDVRVLSSALGAVSAYAEMSVTLSGNSGLCSLNPWPDVNYGSKFLCRVERGDQLVADGTLPAPSVIKIDVENYEPQVLDGLTDCLESSALKAIIFESRDDTFDTIASRLDGFHISHLIPTATQDVTNFVAVRTQA